MTALLIALHLLELALAIRIKRKYCSPDDEWTLFMSRASIEDAFRVQRHMVHSVLFFMLATITAAMNASGRLG